MSGSPTEVNLRGRRIVITRSREQSSELVAKIADLEGEPIAMPVTRIARSAEPAEVESACQGLGRGDFDWVVFASANAVTCFAEGAGTGLSGLMALASVAAIGSRTAKALEQRGARVALVPSQSDAGGLVAALREAGAKGRVLVPRAQGGRPELLQGLGSLFSEVVGLDVYRSVLSGGDDAEVAMGLGALRDGDVHALLVFAPSQVRALVRLLGDAAISTLESIEVVGCIGSTTAQVFESLGISPSVVASRADASTLLEEVVEMLQSTGE